MTITDPAQPRTPAEALRWYAAHPSRADPPPWREQLRCWADELDTTPAVYALPAEPPIGTELWNKVGRWTSRRAPWSDPGDWPAEWCLDGQHYGSGAPWYALLAGGPLSSRPPAQETHATAEVRWYEPHEHGYENEGLHSHSTAAHHQGDVNNPRANDHDGVPTETWEEHQARSGRTLPSAQEADR